MTIYVDNDYKCHVADDGTMTVVDTDAFDGKCNEYIEGYRFVPAGETWTRDDGVQFAGQMVSPWRDIRQYNSEQQQYNQTLLAQYEQALTSIEQALEATS